ncbi:hypothetical protein [Methanolapillus africanus]|uniref:hypothetical protein n=1 Tax=Methanolapillus africanus TaxID=3028297 RepID=UPI0030B8811F
MIIIRYSDSVFPIYIVATIFWRRAGRARYGDTFSFAFLKSAGHFYFDAMKATRTLFEDAKQADAVQFTATGRYSKIYGNS